MKKIGDVTSTADKNGEWTNGNVAAGIAPTILEAGWLNSVQREILGVLVEAGIAQDKNNDNQLKEAIKKIISGGNYATKTEVNSKLAKDQNGADIPNKDTFIKNLGLRDLYLALTGGTLKGPLNIEYVGGRGLTTGATAGTSIYHELYLLGKLVAWWGIINSNELVLENRVAGKKLIIGPDGFKIDGKDIATTEQLFGVGQIYRNLTTSRQNKVWYTNTDSKPRIVHVESNRTGTQYPFSIDIQIIDTGGQCRGDYRWTAADEVVSLTAIVPPGARYSVNGGWGQPTEWTVINFWLEYSL
ncbi:hypothetical protein [Morganella morganii]|uniref:hypothetical protein n=3 Tax=Morganella morganii TaxID=582 RepID=UPI00076B8B9D|nr:hypothetical protein [Morganella morganii]AMG70217.1 hypothetical protein AL531_07610 [Morganella morganii]MBS9582221.1 hypothetical protein [Morganella morganii subsp. morganii]QWL87461.1 hypothetical protein IR216_08975 [Morganella morganii subsp. morganii]